MKKPNKKVLQMAPPPAPAPEPAVAMIPLTAQELGLLGVCVREFKEGALPSLARNTRIDTERMSLDCGLVSQKLRYYLGQIQEQAAKNQPKERGV